MATLQLADDLPIGSETLYPNDAMASDASDVSDDDGEEDYEIAPLLAPALREATPEAPGVLVTPPPQQDVDPEVPVAANPTRVGL